MSEPRGSSREFVFFLQIGYLLALGVFVVSYRVHWIEPRKGFFGPVPFLVPWFGAVGATLLSLSAVFDYRRRAWDVEYRFWHWARPIVGAIVGTVSVLIFQSGILAVGGDLPNQASTTTAKNLLYYVVAFVVGYREDIFRQLIRRLADVILTPPPEAQEEEAEPEEGAEPEAEPEAEEGAEPEPEAEEGAEPEPEAEEGAEPEPEAEEGAEPEPEEEEAEPEAEAEEEAEPQAEEGTEPQAEEEEGAEPQAEAEEEKRPRRRRRQ